MNTFEIIEMFASKIYKTYANTTEIKIMIGNTANHYSWFPGPGTIQVTVSDKLEMKIDVVSIQAMTLSQIRDFKDDLNKAIVLMSVVQGMIDIENSKE